ncbi:MAG: F-type H+-transporting ATPase subunit [Actinobacteria bacterium]|nr:MAG: F-type H+-transporting ATPase subunit [Actinomycetota bacterium]
MRTNELVETYARVLFDLAALADSVDVADEGLRSVVKAVRGNVDLRDALTDTALPAETKRGVLRDIFGEEVSPEVLAVVTLMVDRGHADRLGELASMFGTVAEKERGVVVAEVTSAVALTDDLRAKLIDKLTTAIGGAVSLRESVDPAILGGIVIRVAGRVLDGSVTAQLRDLRQALLTARQGGEA